MKVAIRCATALSFCGRRVAPPIPVHLLGRLCMQAAARAALGEVVRGLSTALVLRAGTPVCPACSPSLACADVRCPACTCHGGGRCPASSAPSEPPPWGYLISGGILFLAFAAGWLLRGFARPSSPQRGGVWLRRLDAEGRSPSTAWGGGARALLVAGVA